MLVLVFPRNRKAWDATSPTLSGVSCSFWCSSRRALRGPAASSTRACSRASGLSASLHFFGSWALIILSSFGHFVKLQSGIPWIFCYQRLVPFGTDLQMHFLKMPQFHLICFGVGSHLPCLRDLHRTRSPH